MSYFVVNFFVNNACKDALERRYKVICGCKISESYLFDKILGEIL